MQESETASRQRIAVVGGGVAGIVAGWLLSRRHDVTLYEADRRPGGHTHTVPLTAGPDAGLGIDTGFIVFNDRNYPLFRRFLADLGVPERDSDMSFSYSERTGGFCYSSDVPNGLLASRANLLRPSFWSLLRDMFRFNRQAAADLAAGLRSGETLGQYLDRGGYGESFRKRYLVAQAAAIWSTAPGRILDFPAAALLRFFDNHGLLQVRGRPQWKVVEGGSCSYVEAFRAAFAGSLRTGTPVASVERGPHGVRVFPRDGAAETFDHVVLAAHADQSLRLLADADDEERRLLGAWTYAPNRTVLHTDSVAMPRRRRAWASWNYLRADGEAGEIPVMVTYYMNRLQRLRARQDYFVSLNPTVPIAPERIVWEGDYHHPQFDAAAFASQQGLAERNGRRNTWWCGSYMGYGFHEDAVRSAAVAARGLGVAW